MTTFLPKDSDNNPIPALRMLRNGAHTIAASTASTKNTVAFNANTRIVSLYATGPIYMNTGDSTIEATTNDHYFPAGIYYDISIGDEKIGQHSHIAAIKADQDCTLYISEKQ